MSFQTTKTVLYTREYRAFAETIFGVDTHIVARNMMLLKKVGVMSVAKVSAVIMAIIGFIEGILFAAFGTMMGSLAGATAIALSGFGLFAIVIFPIMGDISGFIGGAIGAALYNFVADKMGGIEMELVSTQPAMTSAISPTSVKFCASCGAKLPADAKFCGTCGAAQG